MNFILRMKSWLLILAMVYTTAEGDGSRIVMPWMCLERCNDTAQSIDLQLTSLRVNVTRIVNAASFEDYNLGPDSTLVKNDLSQVALPIKEMGLQTWAMISSYPYPPEFLQWMRQAFANPQPLIDSCLKAAADEKLTGFNIDWEPTTAEEVTVNDANAYAAFLHTFSQAMHAAGVLVSVDVATWSPIWNITAIAATDVDFLATMNTYTANTTTWLRQLDAVVDTIPLTKLIVGLECDSSDVGSLSNEALETRFAALNQKGVHGVGLWRMPVPDSWWPFLEAFAAPSP